MMTMAPDPTAAPDFASTVATAAMMQPAPEPEKIMNRDTPDPSPSRGALVAKLQSEVIADRKFFEKRFKQVGKDRRFAAGIQAQGAKDLDNNGKYVANIVQRHIQQKVAAIYAKNPTAKATRRNLLEYQIWDGSTVMLNQVQQAITTGQIDPNMMALIQDIAAGQQKKQMLKRIGDTLNIIYEHYIDNQTVPFKISLKQCARRAITVGFAWAKLDFQRTHGLSPDTQAKISDMQERIANIERLNADLADGEFTADNAQAEELRLAMKELQSEPEVLVSEGLVITYPGPTTIIPDRKCKSLHGFVGAGHVTQEYLLDEDEIKETYGCDIRGGGTEYATGTGGGSITMENQPVPQGAQGGSSDRPRAGKRRVWEVYRSKDGLIYPLCEGYKDVLKEPFAPNIKLDRFYPFFVVMFNEIETDNDDDAESVGEKGMIFPPSDTMLARSMQEEHNRSRNGLREHRKANRPKTFVGQGRLTDEDKKKLEEFPANAVIELQALAPGEKIDDVLQVGKGPPIDQALYDTSFVQSDMEMVLGSAQQNLGGTAGDTATESSIAESSRSAGLASNTDEIDEFLTELFRSAGQVFLMELSAEQAKVIAGPGAVWPELSRKEVADEISLKMVAGSSGMPDQDRKVAALERMMPFLLQIPGVGPDWLLKQVVQRLDDKIDPEEAELSGSPSISTLNAIAQAAAKMGPQGAPAAPGQDPNGGGAAPTGDAQTDPAAQGNAGLNNAPGVPGVGGAPQQLGARPDVEGRLGGAAPMPGA